MSIEELENRISEIDNELFLLDMKDCWDSMDIDYKEELEKEKSKLSAELKELEK